MRKVDLSQDIIPIGEFKTHASQLLRQLHATGRPLVITQNGRPAAVVLTPEEFEELGYREYVKAKIRAGVESAEKVPVLSARQLRNRLKAKLSH
jgi:prevent-host-death family protein